MPATFANRRLPIAVCHRVKTPYTKTDGERRIEPGDIYAPVYGGSDGSDGPGYAIAHPGVFPQTTAADQWTFNQWLTFDGRSDWGKEQFEDDVADGLAGDHFPPAWQNADD